MHHRYVHRHPDLEQVDQVGAFFRQWDIYRRVAEKNLLCHREVCAYLRRFIKDQFADPFDLFDLGCGDAAYLAKALANTAVGSYLGVDLSPPALQLAERNLEPIPCAKRFVCGDYVEALAGEKRQADLIWIGLSFHHLPQAQKERFTEGLRKAVRGTGFVVMFEPVLREGESREAYVRRWKAEALDTWDVLSEAEKAQVYEHVSTSDYPETFADYTAMAKRHGFRYAQSLFQCARGLYQLFAYFG